MAEVDGEDVADSVCCVDVGHSQCGGTSSFDLDNFFERLVADVLGAQDSHIADGDGLGGNVIGNEMGKSAEHVALFSETVGGDLFINTSCITEEIIVSASELKFPWTYWVLVPYWTVSDANLPFGGEELRIVERIVISQIVPSQLIQDQDDSVLVKLVWVLEIDLEYSILDLADRHLVAVVVGCDCAIYVQKWIR